ncbi:flavin reductase family protein [Streptomyces sp. NBC_01361]|uniref:flavin reductase family protein n=1 Tax=Streptomyces sp. NBC_01361 TaxID=2903838 RepID=UPI002E32DD7D|nr:flavin reductase family protein [Streptomyces sp. NBC_01361]
MTATTADRPATAGFLDAMAALAGGVCVVTAAAADGTPAGFTSTAVMSLSRAPQLIAIGVQRGSRTLPLLQGGGRFALNILAADGEPVSRRFADPAVDRFAGLEWTTGEGGVPLLLAQSAYAVLCRVREEVATGDHLLLIADIEEIIPGQGGVSALVHHARHYHGIGA